MDESQRGADELHVVGAAILEGGLDRSRDRSRDRSLNGGRDGRRCLVAQRSATMALPLKWEFPGGKVDAGESARAALAREVREELGLEVAVGERLGVSLDQQGSRPLRLEVYLCAVTGGELALAEHREARWVGAGELDALDWASADRPLLAPLRRALARRAE